MSADGWIRSQRTRHDIDGTTTDADAAIRAALGHTPPEVEQVDTQRPPGRPREQLLDDTGQPVEQPARDVADLQSGAVVKPEPLSPDDWIRKALGR